MRNRCTCSRAYGTQTTGPPEVGWRRQTGKRLHLNRPTRTSMSMGASGKTLTLPACPPQPRTGGINTTLGTSRILRNLTMVGSSETLLSMTIAKTKRGTQRCPRSVLSVHGINSTKHTHTNQLLFINQKKSILIFLFSLN